jgi:hypothetical protein
MIEIHDLRVKIISTLSLAGIDGRRQTRGIRAGEGVTQVANGQHELAPAIEEVHRQTGRQPQHLVVDEGYTMRANVLALR